MVIGTFKYPNERTEICVAARSRLCRHRLQQLTETSFEVLNSLAEDEFDVHVRLSLSCLYFPRLDQRALERWSRVIHLVQSGLS